MTEKYRRDRRERENMKERDRRERVRERRKRDGAGDKSEENSEKLIHPVGHSFSLLDLHVSVPDQGHSIFCFMAQGPAPAADGTPGPHKPQFLRCAPSIDRPEVAYSSSEEGRTSCPSTKVTTVRLPSWPFPLRSFVLAFHLISGEHL